jgi:3-oxoacid CoA-transferase subunit A
MNKVYKDAAEAIRDIFDGAIIGVSGFFVAGVPVALLKALVANGTKDLTLACGCGPLVGFSELLDELVRNRQLRKVIESYPYYRSASKGAASLFEQAVRAGEIEVEVYPMGTLAEKYRCAGAGIAAFYTPTGVGTYAAEGKEVRVFNGRETILETALQPDFAFVHAFMGDPEGNLSFRKTARNFNPELAAAAKVTIAEVEKLVEPGELDPDKVHTPGIFVRRVVKVDRPRVRIAIS